jgi:hypothetical protein
VQNAHADTKKGVDDDVAGNHLYRGIQGFFKTLCAVRPFALGLSKRVARRIQQINNH